MKNLLPLLLPTLFLLPVAVACSDTDDREPVLRKTVRNPESDRANDETPKDSANVPVTRPTVRDSISANTAPPSRPDADDNLSVSTAQFEREIRELLDRRSRAMENRDIATMSRLMADDLTLVHITGRRQSKSEWLEDIRSEAMRYYDIKLENLNIRITGNRAIATYLSVLDARIYGSRNVWRLNSTMYLEKRNGTWLWVNPW